MTIKKFNLKPQTWSSLLYQRKSITKKLEINPLGKMNVFILLNTI